MRPKSRARFCTLLVAFSAACGGEKSGVEGASDGGTDTDAELAPTDTDAATELPSNVVDFETDDEAAVTGSISALIGGHIEAVGADGTRFALDVPAFALASDVDVTVLPLLTVLGVSEAGPVHGVQLSPEGLHFQGFARLTISPAEAIAPADLSAFRAEGGGGSPGAALLDVAEDVPVILFDRLSVTGIARATDDDRAALFALTADDPALVVYHRVGEALQSAWHARLAGDDVTYPDLSDVFAAHEDGPLADLRDAAAESCDTRASYLDGALDYAALRELVGSEPSATMSYQLLPIYQSRDAACEDEVVSVCRASQEPGYLLEYRLRAIRTRRLLETAGLIPKSAEPDLPAEYRSVETTCAMGGYTVSGGGDGLSVGGEVDDPSYPFALAAQIDGSDVTLVFAPADDNRNRGSYTYDGGSISGSGDYTLSELADGVLGLELSGFRCIDDVCNAMSANLTFTPE